MTVNPWSTEVVLQTQTEAGWRHRPALCAPPAPRPRHQLRLFGWAPASRSPVRPLPLRPGVPDDLPPPEEYDDRAELFRDPGGPFVLYRRHRAWIPLVDVLAHDWDQPVPDTVWLDADAYAEWARTGRLAPEHVRAPSPFSVRIEEAEMKDRLRRSDFAPTPDQEPTIRLVVGGEAAQPRLICPVDVDVVPLRIALGPLFEWAETLAAFIDPLIVRLLCSADDDGAGC